jgi:hypothetical protein
MHKYLIQFCVRGMLTTAIDAAAPPRPYRIYTAYTCHGGADVQSACPVGDARELCVHGACVVIVRGDDIAPESWLARARSCLMVHLEAYRDCNMPGCTVIWLCPPFADKYLHHLHTLQLLPGVLAVRG